MFAIGHKIHHPFLPESWYLFMLKSRLATDVIKKVNPYKPKGKKIISANSTANNTAYWKKKTIQKSALDIRPIGFLRRSLYAFVILFMCKLSQKCWLIAGNSNF